MIRLQRDGLFETPQLAAARSRFAGATTDEAGIKVVADVSGAAWTSMREQLFAAQHAKCAYCEAYLRPRMIEIDHIRPKKATHYWWLAYSIENLVAACRACNNAKSSRWALRNGTTKLTPRQQPWVTPEPAMLVDPTTDDPTPHLTYVFAGGLWRIAATSTRGRWTIENLELDGDAFTYEVNEFILQALDPYAREVEQAKRALDTERLSEALAKLSSFDRPQQRWLQLVRTICGHVIAGTYQRPALSPR